MTALVSLLRFLFWLLVIRWGVRLLGRVLRSMLQKSSAPVAEHHAQGVKPELSRRLVRDPVCGMHVDEALAIPSRDGGERVHFCSQACRDAYRGSVKKFAAHG